MATIPKLALIPSGVKAGKLYSVLPTNGDGDFTTTRNTVATRVNENGLIEEVASNVPRLDYSDGTCPSLLLEPTATNLIVYSELFSDASWTKAGSSVVSGFVSPSADSLLTAFKLVEDTSNTIHYIKKSLSSSLGIKTFSFYVDYTKNDYVSCSMTYNNNSRGIGLIIDLTNDTVFDSSISSTDYTIKIKTVGNFKRIELSAQNTVDDILDTMHISPYNGEAYTWNGGKRLPSYQGDGTSGVYIWGAQLEENSYATSYIKNEGTALGITRVADTATGSGNSTVINSSEGVLYAEISKLDVSSSESSIFLTKDSSNEIRINLADNNRLNIFVNVGGVYQVYMDNATFNLQDYNKIAVKYKLNDYSVFVNGTKIYTNTSATVPPNMDELKFNNPKMKTKSVQVYTTALSDAELTTLTTI